MRIYNFQERPHLILSDNELLFRDSPDDTDVKRHAYKEIKKISFFHRYDTDHEPFIWMKVHMKDQHTPLLVQISMLNEPVEEVLEGIADVVAGKTEVKLPSKTWLNGVKTGNKVRKRVQLSVAVFLLSLPLIHHLFPPHINELKPGALNIKPLQSSGFCSNRAKAVYKTAKSESLEVIEYCGIFTTWQEDSRKTIPKRFLTTELSDLTFDDYILHAEEHIDKKAYSEAQTNIDQAIYLDPQSETPHILLAKIEDRQNRLDGAISHLKKALSLNPSSSRAHNFIAELYIDTNNIKEAQKHFETSLKFEQSAYVYASLAYTENELGLTDDAIRHYEKSLFEAPDDTYVLTELGLLYWQKHEFEKAAEKLQKAYELDPSDALAFLNFFEISLITSATVTKTHKEKFINEHRQDTKLMIIYDMLDIIALSIQNEDTEQALEAWRERYEGQYPDWSMREIRTWLDMAKLDIDHTQHVQSTIGFFIAQQQAYKIKHLELRP